MTRPRRRPAKGTARSVEQRRRSSSYGQLGWPSGASISSSTVSGCEDENFSSAERVIWLHGLPSCAPGTSAFSDIKPGLGCLCIYASRYVITGLTHKK